MAFGAKTVAALIKDLEKPDLDTLDITNNASFRMNPAENLKKLAEAMKSHKALKKLILVDCEVEDKACEVLKDILSVNSSIEELNLEKNHISSEGAKKLAEGLTNNRGVKTLNLLQQHACKAFGDDCLMTFIDMYQTNMTLTKITWRLDSRKSFQLAKCQTRNIEIAKRVAAGKEFQDLLPDHLRDGAPAEATPAAAPAAKPNSDEDAAEAERQQDEQRSHNHKEHAEKVADAATADAKTEEPAAGYAAEEAPAAAPAAAEEKAD